MCAHVCEDCKIYSESCRRGLEGGYVWALIKNLVCKNRKAKAIHFCANRHHESDHQTRKDKCRAQRLLHVQINNGGPTAGMEENSVLPGLCTIDNPNTTMVWGLVSVYLNIKYILWILEREQCQTAVEYRLQRVPLQWDTQGRYAARLRASEAQ